MIESYGLNDQPACIRLHINERANQVAAEIREKPCREGTLRVQINTPSSQTRTRQLRSRTQLKVLSSISPKRFADVSAFRDLRIHYLFCDILRGTSGDEVRAIPSRIGSCASLIDTILPFAHAKVLTLQFAREKS
jgi:hypothetical protein